MVQGGEGENDSMSFRGGTEMQGRGYMVAERAGGTVVNRNIGVQGESWRRMIVPCGAEGTWRCRRRALGGCRVGPSWRTNRTVPVSPPAPPPTHTVKRALRLAVYRRTGPTAIKGSSDIKGSAAGKGSHGYQRPYGFEGRLKTGRAERLPMCAVR